MTTPDFVFESSLILKEEKIKFLQMHSNDLVIMDLTSFDLIDFFGQYPNLIAATSTKLNLDQHCEVAIKEHKTEVLNFLKTQNLNPLEIKHNEGFFYLPRILSTIVNEAYFALEDAIATSLDIDCAMKFGVNYPEGPFKWAEGRESYVVTLLDQLYLKTKNDRYLVAPKLRSLL